MKSSSFLKAPVSKPGWRAVWLEVVFIVMFTVNVVVFIIVSDETFWRQFILPFYALIMLICGLAGGVFGLIAVIRQKERALLVWLSILVGLFVLLIFLGELMQGLMYFLGS
jgi:hypothetical protein